MTDLSICLTDAEAVAVRDLMARKDLNAGVILRQALRLYQMADLYQRDGYRMVWLDSEGKEMFRPTGCCGD